jgi:hypothetical protein
LEYHEPRNGMHGFVWEYQPGIVVNVSATGLTDDEVRAAVASVRPIDEQQFNALPRDE